MTAIVYSPAATEAQKQVSRVSPAKKVSGFMHGRYGNAARGFNAFLRSVIVPAISGCTWGSFPENFQPAPRWREMNASLLSALESIAYESVFATRRERFVLSARRRMGT